MTRDSFAFVPKVCVMCALGTAVPLALTAQPTPLLKVISGTTANGAATPLWLQVVRDRLAPADYDAAAELRRILTGPEASWAALIEARRRVWEQEIPSLITPFAPVPPPDAATILLGNRGGSDAFAPDATTIAFDLRELQSSYGDADAAGNGALIDRLFRHEYTHLLQKAWLREHPWPSTTPLQRALLDLWLEGLGNYYSLSERWRGQGGHAAPASEAARSVLEPRFVARLAALACASPSQVARLRQGLSSGRFDQKWGALPVALWIEGAQPTSAAALRRLVEEGPPGVWSLAERHLSASLRGALSEVRELAALCGPDGG